MYHFLYRTESDSGKFYVGRHSTENIDDGYLGSGKWIRSVKNTSNLKRIILKFVDSFEILLDEEQDLIRNVIDDPMNMNFNNNSCGWSSGLLNPAYSESEKKRRKENGWMKSEEGRRWFSENNPSKIPSVRERRRQKGIEQWEKGIHNFQNEETIEKTKLVTIERNKTNNPMWDKTVCEKVSKTLKENYKNGNHIFCDPEVRKISSERNRQRWIDNNPMKDPLIVAKYKVPKEKVVCPHCNKIGGKPVMVRYHFDKCKSKSKEL